MPRIGKLHLEIYLGELGRGLRGDVLLSLSCGLRGRAKLGQGLGVSRAVVLSWTIRGW